MYYYMGYNEIKAKDKKRHSSETWNLDKNVTENSMTH
jgi:hypothetical protein